MGISPFFFGTNKNMLNKRADKLELLRIAEAVALEKSIDKELIINSMETGIAKAAKSKFGQDNEIKVMIDRETGNIELFRKLIIVEKPENYCLEESFSNWKLSSYLSQESQRSHSWILRERFPKIY